MVLPFNQDFAAQFWILFQQDVLGVFPAVRHQEHFRFAEDKELHDERLIVGAIGLEIRRRKENASNHVAREVEFVTGLAESRSGSLSRQQLQKFPMKYRTIRAR